MLKKILTLVIIVACLSAGTNTLTAHAYDPFAGKDGVCNSKSGVKTSASTACASATTSNPLLGPNGLLVKIIHIIAIIAGAAAVIIILVSGLRYVLSSGDTKAVGEAKSTLLYALIGLIVIVAAQTIISFVLSKL